MKIITLKARNDFYELSSRSFRDLIYIGARRFMETEKGNKNYPTDYNFIVMFYCGDCRRCTQWVKL